MQQSKGGVSILTGGREDTEISEPQTNFILRNGDGGYLQLRVRMITRLYRKNIYIAS
jgi:hypothetical protein